MTSQNALVVVEPFARYERPSSPSFPRRRESTPQAFGNGLHTDWILAFAGMTVGRVEKADTSHTTTARVYHLQVENKHVLRQQETRVLFLDLPTPAANS